jgi:hypothetical protein
VAKICSGLNTGVAGCSHTFALLLLALSVIHWPESLFKVHLYMQLLGKEKDKTVPRAILLRFWSRRKQYK